MVLAGGGWGGWGRALEALEVVGPPGAVDDCRTSSTDPRRWLWGGEAEAAARAVRGVGRRTDVVHCPVVHRGEYKYRSDFVDAAARLGG